jgi:hypothetical protein
MANQIFAWETSVTANSTTFFEDYSGTDKSCGCKSYSGVLITAKMSMSYEGNYNHLIIILDCDVYSSAFFPRPDLNSGFVYGRNVTLLDNWSLNCRNLAVFGTIYIHIAI